MSFDPQMLKRSMKIRRLERAEVRIEPQKSGRYSPLDGVRQHRCHHGRLYVALEMVREQLTALECVWRATVCDHERHKLRGFRVAEEVTEHLERSSPGFVRRIFGGVEPEHDFAVATAHY
ncbi:MAG: hypothetical protein R6X02_12195 [Enhygromyxa sp.]